MYKEEQVEKLYIRCQEIYTKCLDLQADLIRISLNMPDSMKEHAVYGVARRLGFLRESMRFFFDDLPPDLDKEPDNILLSQANAYLHAFLINCSGITDNMAWLLAYYCSLDERMDLEKNKLSIGLFKKDFKKNLPKRLLDKVKKFDNWNNHIVGYRHPTAHRIPPYIIPYIHSSDTGENDYTPHYIHAFDKSHPVPLHAQSICDLGAVIELVEALYLEIAETYS
jgi:hypothetical protein